MKPMITSALALAIATAAGGALAQSDTVQSPLEDGTAVESDAMVDTKANLIRSRDITGGEVYTINTTDDAGWDPQTMFSRVEPSWNEIGEIEDLVLSRDGKVTGIVAEVGGFLDMGDKHVMIRVEDLSLVAVDDRSYAYVTRLSEEQLEEMEGVDEGFWN